MINVGMNLVKNYYNLCLAIVDRADKDSKKKVALDMFQNTFKEMVNISLITLICLSYVKVIFDFIVIVLIMELDFVLGTKEKQMISRSRKND